MSEKSDGRPTTATNISGRGSAYNDRRNDRQELAKLTGLSNIEDLHQEKFRVE